MSNEAWLGSEIPLTSWPRFVEFCSYAKHVIRRFNREPFEFPDGIKQVPRSFIPCPIFPGFVAVAYRLFAFNGNIYRRNVSQMG